MTDTYKLATLICHITRENTSTDDYKKIVEGANPHDIFDANIASYGAFCALNFRAPDCASEKDMDDLNAADRLAKSWRYLPPRSYRPEAPVTDCEKQLRDNVLALVEQIENPPMVCVDDGSTVTYDEDKDEYTSDDTGEIVDADIVEPMSGYGFLNDALDIEYRVGGDKKSYVSAKVLVAFGGPNIWIDTGTKDVVGTWWGDSFKAPYHTDAIGIDNACAEIFEC